MPFVEVIPVQLKVTGAVVIPLIFVPVLVLVVLGGERKFFVVVPAEGGDVDGLLDD